MRFENLSGAEQGEIERSLHRWRDAASRRLELETKLPKHEPMNSHKKEPKTADNRSESKIAESKRESKIADNHREDKKDRRDPVSQPADLYLHGPRGALVDRSTNRTPPVVSRRPVSTAGLGQGGIHESPDQRLANPKFVPQASNRGRSEPAQKATRESTPLTTRADRSPIESLHSPPVPPRAKVNDWQSCVHAAQGAGVANPSLAQHIQTDQKLQKERLMITSDLNRREWLKLAGGAGLASIALTSHAAVAAGGRPRQAPVANSPYSQHVISLRPVGYWRLGETNGPTAFDWSGHAEQRHLPRIAHIR